MNKLNNIMFVGGFFTKDMKTRIIKDSKNSIQNAANNLQWNLIDGICEQYSGKLTLLTTPFIGTYPINYKKKYIHYEESFYRNAVVKQLGFNNIIGYKNYSIYNKLKKTILDWIDEDESNRTLIFYSIQGYYLKVANWLKKNKPNVHLHIIVPDLPHYMYLDKQSNLLYFLKVKHQVNLCEKYIDLFDTYTVLTEQMAKKLNINNDKFTVVEGMINPDNDGEIPNDLSKYGRYCLYTGTLTKAYGILDLVRSFDTIESDDLNLLICGEGETKAEILKYQSKNKHIIYLGLVNSEMIHALQKNALFLINPRENNETFTKYSFPSKTMEYLGSGRPVLCFKLDGIPREYDNYLQYFDDKENSIAEKIIQFNNMPQNKLQDLGIKGRNFVYQQKSNRVQVSKILELISNNQKVK